MKERIFSNMGCFVLICLLFVIFVIIKVVWVRHFDSDIESFSKEKTDILQFYCNVSKKESHPCNGMKLYLPMLV